MDVTIEKWHLPPIIVIDFNAKVLLHTKKIPAAHSPNFTAHFVSKNTLF